jgi:hypothetical protein
MKHLKKFERYFFEEEEDLQAKPSDDFLNFTSEEDTECEPCGSEEEEEVEGDFYDEGEEEIKDWNDSQTLERVKSFDSFLNEEKKFSAAQLAAQKKFKERIKGKKSDDKEDKKEDKKSKGAKPDFLDLDKDGDKKEPMKKAAKEAKEKEEKGLTAKQKKLPAPLRERILKNQNKK